MQTTDPVSAGTALEFLRNLGAPPRLLAHGKIVSDVAVQISAALACIGVQHDQILVSVGSALHDAGKIEHPEELIGQGNCHEAAGELILLQNGISPQLARICRTHGQWHTSDVTLDERVIALADHLWRGKRNEELELLVVRDIAQQLQTEVWNIIVKLDPTFEAIAAGAETRLAAAGR